MVSVHELNFFYREKIFLSGNFSKFENKSNEPPKAKSSRPLSRLFGGNDKKPAAAEPRPKVRPLSTNFSAVNQKSGGGGTGGAGGTNKPAQRPYSMFDTKQGQKQVTFFLASITAPKMR